MITTMQRSDKRARRMSKHVRLQPKMTQGSYPRAPEATPTPSAVDLDAEIQGWADDALNARASGIWS
jgi:hypothetical protein